MQRRNVNINEAGGVPFSGKKGGQIIFSVRCGWMEGHKVKNCIVYVWIACKMDEIYISGF